MAAQITVSSLAEATILPLPVRRLLSVTLCGLIAPLLLTGCSRGERRAESGTARTLTIGTDATFPPLESIKGDEFVGFDIDLGNALGKELGAKVNWVNSGFDGIFAALQTGKFDMVMSSVTITADRKK